MPDVSDRTLNRTARRSPADAREESEGPLSWAAIAGSLSALAFWSAIALPALYLPLLVTGLGSAAELLTFLGLFALHVVTLLAGRSHRRER